MSGWRTLFTTPLHDGKQWGFVIVVIITLAFMPQVTPNDWSLNTDSLSAGLSLYDNASYVYPPWALILLWPYRLMTAPGTLIATGAVVAWLCYRRQWSLSRFFSIIINPFFVFTLMFSNIDILVMIFPLLLWEAARATRWQIAAWGLSMAILLLKPQGGMLIIPYLIWQNRDQRRPLLFAGIIAALIVVPISLLGSPPLVSQWFDNLTNPSAQNLQYWQDNNVSLTNDIGFIAAAIVLILSVGTIYTLMRRFKRTWTQHHTLAALFLFIMLVSPYTSNQSIVVPMTLVPTWPAAIIAYIGTFLGGAVGVYKDYNAWWTLFFGLSALWLFRDSRLVAEKTQATITGS